MGQTAPRKDRMGGQNECLMMEHFEIGSGVDVKLGLWSLGHLLDAKR